MQNYSEVQVKNFFISWKCHVWSLIYSIVVFLATPRTSKSVTQWWVLVHYKGYISFEYNFWTKTYQSMTLCQLIHITKSNIFQKYFEWFGASGLTCQPAPITQSLWQVASFALFWKCELGQLKMENNNWYKVNRSHYIVWDMLRMFVIKYLTKYYFDTTWDSKEIIKSLTFILQQCLQILNFVDSVKAQ